MLPFSRAGTNIYLSSLELEMKSISIFIYFYSSWVCGSTLWLHRNQQFLPLLYFLLIFPLIYLCDTLISCLEYHNSLPSAWAFSSHIFLLAFSSQILDAFFSMFLLLNDPSRSHCHRSISLSSQPLLVMANIQKKTLHRLFIILFFYRGEHHWLLSVGLSSSTHTGKCIK